MATDDPVYLHVSTKEQHDDVPEPGVYCFWCPEKKCPGERNFKVGFGMAGGGYGTYIYCPQCEIIVEKSQES